jgi:hypothetical protein
MDALEERALIVLKFRVCQCELIITCNIAKLKERYSDLPCDRRRCDELLHYCLCAQAAKCHSKPSKSGGKYLWLA